jgi:hypothetical protein
MTPSTYIIAGVVAVLMIAVLIVRYFQDRTPGAGDGP